MSFRLLLKGVSIIGIVMLLSVALAAVDFKVYERKQYREQAFDTVAQGWSGSQIVAGPIIELSYQKTVIEKQFDQQQKKHIETKKLKRWSEFHLLKSLEIQSKLIMQDRYVGIYTVPVYTAKIEIRATHQALDLKLPGDTQFVGARLLISINDMRGLHDQPALNWGGQTLAFEPGDQQKLLGSYLQVSLDDDLLNKDANIDLQFSLRGLNQIQFIPTADDVSATINADWPHPSFTGRYLPGERDVNEQGFSARWLVNSLASGIVHTLKECQSISGHCYTNLSDTGFGASLVSPVDVYQMTNRAIKYGFLFVLLTFAVFALVELQAHKRIHAIQYGFVGAALAIFYLLQISLSEHTSFFVAYLIASLACSGLISAYMKVVLASSKLAYYLGLALLSLYAMMFAVLQSEDYAFVMGAILVFTVLSAIMYSTRRVDWRLLNQNSDAKSSLTEST